MAKHTKVVKTALIYHSFSYSNVTSLFGKECRLPNRLFGKECRLPNRYLVRSLSKRKINNQKNIGNAVCVDTWVALRIYSANAAKLVEIRHSEEVVVFHAHKQG
jgi:hypothetical protein